MNPLLPARLASRMMECDDLSVEITFTAGEWHVLLWDCGVSLEDPAAHYALPDLAAALEQLALCVEP